jgi:hypothetical protein
MSLDTALDHALLTIIAEVQLGTLTPSQALEEIKQAVDYHRKPEEKPR